MNRIVPLFCVAALSACTAPNNGVRVSAQQPAKPTAKMAAVPQSRNEPIFYNGKTYQLRFSPAGPGSYAMSVAGMSATQTKDAEAVATSSLRYFACRDGQNGKLTDTPHYDGSLWRMTARCA
jgi:lipopolysaccharide export system protein LptC